MKGLVPVSLAALLLAGCATAPETVAVASRPSTYIVFFPRGDATLTPASREVIAQAAAAIQAAHPEQVILAGGADTRASLNLAGPRTSVVREALAQDGVSTDLLTRSNLEAVNLVMTDTAEQRVEIQLVQPGTDLARSRGYDRVAGAY